MEVVNGGYRGRWRCMGRWQGCQCGSNGRIDLVPVDQRPDRGDSAVGGSGVGYTLLGATVLVWLGWPVVAALGFVWQAGRQPGGAEWCWCRRLWPPACRCCEGYAPQPWGADGGVRRCCGEGRVARARL